MKMEPIECSETSSFSTQTPGRCPKENLPMKMEPIECSETSAFSTQTPGRYPKENLPMNIKPIECSETSAFSTQTPGIYPKENALNIGNIRINVDCCSGKVISITYSECVFVATGIHHTMHVRHIVVCSLPGPGIFFRIIS